jgi:RNA polymerase sigma-70 factor (ECF subfamily)
MADAHAAIAALVVAHAARLRALCQRVLGDHALAEDAVQNTFIQALRAWSGFAGRSDPLVWLRRIAVRCAIQLLQDRGRWQPDQSSDIGIATCEWPCALNDRHALLQAAQSALSALTPRERMAFVLRHVEEFDLDEIAEQLGCNVNTCKQTIFRGAQKMRRALALWRSGP